MRENRTLIERASLSVTSAPWLILLCLNQILVGEGGLEPPLPCENQILSLACIPISPLAQNQYLITTILPIPPSRHQSDGSSHKSLKTLYFDCRLLYNKRRLFFKFIMDKNTQNHTNANDQASRQAAEQVILNQLDQIYGISIEPDDAAIPQTTSDSATPQLDITASTTTPLSSSYSTTPVINNPSQQSPANTQLSTENLYSQTYQQNAAPTTDWQTYHSAWQNYYQKYYEYYYVQQLKQQTDSVKAQFDQAVSSKLAELSANTSTDAVATSPSSPINPKDQALKELRDKLRAKMTDRAQKARKSRHFWPVVAALTVTTLFLFLQYNQLLIGQVRAYVTPADTSPSTIIVDPTINLGVGPEPKLIIPKINVNVPVAYDIGNDNASQQEAMKHGVAHFAVPGASAKPGEIGNTPISGHSSNDVFEKGDYKFIFAQLDRLEVGDLIYADYKGVRYTYNVTKKETVWPNEWEKLVYPTTKPVITLITCTPIGTTHQRLLVTAEQIAPDPELAAQPAAPSINITKQAMPGTAPSLLERLFGKK